MGSGAFMSENIDDLLDARREWANGFGYCFVCRGPACDIHEIERKSHAPAFQWAHTCNYMSVCRTCHDGPLATMRHARQLAFKLLSDAEHFDLEIWNQLREGDGPPRVTLSDVIDEIEPIMEEWRVPEYQQYTMWKRIDRAFIRAGGLTDRPGDLPSLRSKDSDADTQGPVHPGNESVGGG